MTWKNEGEYFEEAYKNSVYFGKDKTADNIAFGILNEIKKYDSIRQDIINNVSSVDNPKDVYNAASNIIRGLEMALLVIYREHIIEEET